MKRYTSTRKRYGNRRYRKRTTKKSNKPARRQQRAASTWIRKKYTRVYQIGIAAGQDVWQKTLSLIGGRNQTNPGDTITLFDVNQDNQLRTDMGLYQFFRIRGVAFKMFFPMPTDVASSPVQWACAYSANEVILPEIAPDRVQTLATYQTGSCNQNKPVSRFYNTANTYRRFGIQYCDTAQFAEFGLNVPASLYGNQLLGQQGSAVNLKVYRQTQANTNNVLGRLQVTYYVTYKGNKGTNSLVTP